MYNNVEAPADLEQQAVQVRLRTQTITDRRRQLRIYQTMRYRRALRSDLQAGSRPYRLAIFYAPDIFKGTPAFSAPTEFLQGRFPLTRIVSRSIPIADTVIGYWYWITMTLSGIAHRCGSQRGRQSRPSRTRQWRRRGWKCRISSVSAAETITPTMSSSTVSSSSEVLLRATAAQPLKAKLRTASVRLTLFLPQPEQVRPAC